MLVLVIGHSLNERSHKKQIRLKDSLPDFYSCRNSYLYRFTPLCLASERGHLQIVEKLIDAGAELNAKTGLGLSPLALAVQVVLTIKCLGFRVKFIDYQ